MSGLAGAIPALRHAATPAAEAQALARLSRDPVLSRQLDGFARAVERAPDLKTALRDPRVLGVLLPALGLPDAVDQPGLALRALTSDPKDKEGLLARLPDARWRTAAETLGLAGRGIEALRDPALRATLADGLRRLAWQRELDARHPGIGDALAFQQRAARARTAVDVLGDPVLRRVVTGALGLPPQLAFQSVEAQARAVSARLDVTKLQNPREAARIAERYMAAAAAAAGGSASGGLGLLGLPAGGLLI